jgi:hypothetical protein
MVFVIEARSDVESIFPLRGCFCFDNRMGTFIGGITVGILALIAWVLVVLDLADWASDNFDIQGGFPSWWRMPFWKGFVACDVVMFFCHLVIVAVSIALIIGILFPGKYKLYRLRPIVLAWLVLTLLYLLTELGVSLYVFSWFGLIGWRLPFLIFVEMFYIIRFVLNLMFIVVSYSYYREIDLELSAPTNADEMAVEYMSANPSVVNQQMQIHTFPSSTGPVGTQESFFKV